MTTPAPAAKIMKLPRKNLWRIMKQAKHDFEETYVRIDQRPDLANVAESLATIDNIYILKHFTVIVWTRSLKNSEIHRELKTINHCKEADLGEQFGKKILEVQYSENGRVFLDPAQKGPFVYGNLRAGDFNVVHILVE